jgi:hypothetical protein
MEPSPSWHASISLACQEILRIFWNRTIAQSVQQPAKNWTILRSNHGGGEIFPTCSERPWGQPSLLYNGYLVIPVIKRPERGINHPTTSSAEVKEK